MESTVPAHPFCHAAIGGHARRQEVWRIAIGWETSKEASRYTKEASRRRLAGEGMHLLAGRTQNAELVAPSEAMVAPPLKASDSKGKK